MNPIKTPTHQVELSDGQTLTVREIAWHEATEFAELLISEITKLESAPNQISQVIVGSRALSEWLIRTSAGLGDADLKQLRARDAARILDAALELNLTDELVSVGKSIAGRVMKWLPAGMLPRIPGPAGSA